MSKAKAKKAIIRAEKKVKAQTKKEAKKVEAITKKTIQVQVRETKKVEAIAEKVKTFAKKAFDKKKKESWSRKDFPIEVRG